MVVDIRIGVVEVEESIVIRQEADVVAMEISSNITTMEVVVVGVDRIHRLVMVVIIIKDMEISIRVRVGGVLGGEEVCVKEVCVGNHEASFLSAWNCCVLEVRIEMGLYSVKSRIFICFPLFLTWKRIMNK